MASYKKKIDADFYSAVLEGKMIRTGKSFVKYDLFH
jgi:hypothetical protein